MVRPRALGAAVDGIVDRLRSRHRVVVLEDPGGLSEVRDEWDVLAGPGSMCCDDALLDRLPRLRAVIAAGRGIEGIDRVAASARGVLIGDGAVDENARDMASATVMLMLALLHDLEGARARLVSGLPPPPIPAGTFLGAQTIGLVGYGRVARRVVQLLAPWNPRLLVCSRRDPADLPPNASRAPLENLLAASDVVSLHASLDASSRGLVDASAVARMKRGAILINTARGGLVDEAAVARALESGHLRGAAFDCFEREPLPAASPLRAAPRALLTPHVIGHTVEGARAMVAMFEDNIRRTLRGDPPCSLRNPEALDRLRPTRSTTS